METPPGLLRHASSAPTPSDARRHRRRCSRKTWSRPAGTRETRLKRPSRAAPAFRARDPETAENGKSYCAPSSLRQASGSWLSDG